MAKRSGPKTSRSERRAGKQRAQRAREHGLPERREPAGRARASTPEPGSRGDGDDRSSDAPPGRSPKKAGIPTLVKVIAGALVILLGVYILSQRREQALTDTKPAPELPSAEASASAESPTTAVPQPEPELQPEPRASAAPAAAVEPAQVVSVTPPSKPVVAMPLVSAPVRPLVPKPVVAPPAAVTTAKPPAPAAAPTPPVAAPPAPAAAPAPPPAAPKASPPAAPTKPVDNPY